MTKESSDLEIAYKIIENILDDINTKYINSNWSDKVTYKTEGYLDGLVFCLDVLKNVKGIRESSEFPEKSS